ncbi:ImmA/IrrE family metallo-endopeptidase [Streptomyces sp. NBC_00878]|uniref:ImmA/IrrE family metallo-endopeptidase n=1 Tax=Streptomyces sp. NBC_00878 TaxID=2975854 RepID=UPI00225855A4|nr:ImmA/IrrE family metallo-endopeptidase [Streptomyces sp. NBC_00878]MCX4902820.1 ImmA/IrrE family metallo-endopeptidase [Streptomyces sp. NBC_00878]
MKLGGLQRRCKALIRKLEIPSPFDVHTLIQSVAQRQGRPIQLMAIAMPAGSPCGLWISTASTDYIFYEKQASPLHQEHIIVHELGHLLCGHVRLTDVNNDITRRLMPTLSPNMIERVLQRTYYNTPEEKEAEMIASLILQGVHRSPSGLNQAVPEVDEAVRRVQRLLVD